MHAEPTTFGLKLLVFQSEMARQQARLESALAEAAVGKISGAVGTLAHLPPEVEEAVCRRLGIGFEPVATQVVQRDRHAALMSVLALIASSLEKFSVEFRHLARTEVREVQEEFGSRPEGLLRDAAQAQPLALRERLRARARDARLRARRRWRTRRSGTSAT